MSDNTQAALENLPAQTREVFEALLQQPLVPMSALQTEVEDYLDTIDEKSREYEFMDAGRLGDVVKNLGTRQASNPNADFDDGPSRGFDYAKATKKILEEGVGSVLEAAAKNPREMRNIVYKLGKKFRPWEASKMGKKLAEWAGKGGKVLGPLAVCFDFYMEYREEKEKEDRQRHLAKTRLAMQRQFRDLADAQVQAMQGVFTELKPHTTRKMLAEIEQRTSDIAGRDAQEKALADTAGRFIRDSRQLQERIADANRTSADETSGEQQRATETAEAPA